MTGFGWRLLAAILLACAAAVAVLIYDGSVAAALIALVGALAAVLVGAGTGIEPEVASPRPPEPAPLADLDIGEVLDRLVEPVLVVEDGRVSLANAAARRLLGEHVLTEPVHVAIRHPAAAERLRVGGTLSDPPIHLVGLGTLDQRWEMRVGATSHGQQIVHLIDQTRSYAAERMRVDFVANASHELRTPLASILGYVETLRDGAGAEEAIRARFLKIMDDEARRMQRLIEDLISLSRIEAEKYRLPADPIDAAALLREVCAAVVDAHDGRGRDLTVEIAPALPGINGDRAQLSQVLHNVIGNAMKYGRAGTPVTIMLGETAAGMLRFSVSDQGDGISAEHIPRLTERFYRVDTGRSRSLGGTGLGLAIVKHVVERHRGRLEIASTVGEGTTVSVLLPPASLSSKRNAIVTQDASSAG